MTHLKQTMSTSPRIGLASSWKALSRNPVTRRIGLKKAGNPWPIPAYPARANNPLLRAADQLAVRLAEAIQLKIAPDEIFLSFL